MFSKVYMNDAFKVSLNCNIFLNKMTEIVLKPNRSNFWCKNLNPVSNCQTSKVQTLSKVTRL